MAILGVKPRSRGGQLAKNVISAISGRFGAVATIPGGAEWFAHEQITIDSTSGGKTLTAATYKDADIAMITVATAAIRYRLDGGEPSTTSGHVAYPGDVIELENEHEIVHFRAIEDTATDAVIDVSYGRN